MTTTTAAAGLVMRHLDFVHQAFCADWDVRFISVTEAGRNSPWPGPRRAICWPPCWATARPALHGLWPRSRWGVAGAAVPHLFSGEEGYEIAVPTRYGEALFRDLLARAETMGGGPTGWRR
jgi:methylglutamate dehydrogenase subunit C